MRDFLPNLPRSASTWGILGDWQLNSRSLETYYGFAVAFHHPRFCLDFGKDLDVFLDSKKIGDALKNMAKQCSV